MESFNLKGNQTMKTTFRLIGAVATAAALFSSCKKEAFNEEVKPGTVEMTIIAGADDATRTVLGSDGAVTWATSREQLAVIEAAVSGTTTTTAKETSEVGVTNDEGATMSFGVSMTAKTADSFEYYALYPNSAYVEKPTDLAKVKVNLASTQAPTESSFGPSADVLVAKPETGLRAQPTELNLQFARVIAVGKMTIKDLNTSENVKKVTFTATGKDVTGSSYIDFTTAAGVEYGYLSYGVDNVVLDYSDKTIAANGMTAYFTCWPFELAAGESFSVVVETDTYAFTKKVTLAEGKSLAFKVGRASTFSVDFSGIEGVEKLVPDGAYVVAYENNMMTVGTTSNKYRDVATLPTANADNSYSVDATAAWNFVYDSTTDTYQIYSASDNTLYLQGSSSASDFKLVAEADATSFKITKNENGTFKIGITSNSKTRYIGYNTTAPRFAMYAGSTQQPADVNLYPAKVVILPKITVQKTLEVPSAGTNYELYTFPVAFTNVETAEVTVHGDADCTTTVDWIDVGISDDLTEVQYMVEENTGAARTAYIKIHAQGPEATEATAIVTVNQAAASTGGGEIVTLFTEGFGINKSSARVWEDTYKEQGGISSVYSGSTYTITNAKQSKNTVGKTKSGLAQSKQNNDAIFEIKSLNVAAYSDLSVSYYWKAGSIRKTYSTSLYYSKDGGTTYTEVNKTQGTGATTFVEVKYTLPADAVSSNLCLKVVFNTSNTQAVIDDFVLKGKK